MARGPTGVSFTVQPSQCLTHQPLSATRAPAAASSSGCTRPRSRSPTNLLNSRHCSPGPTQPRAHDIPVSHRPKGEERDTRPSLPPGSGPRRAAGPQCVAAFSARRSPAMRGPRALSSVPAHRRLTSAVGSLFGVRDCVISVLRASQRGRTVAHSFKDTHRLSPTAGASH